LLERITPNLSLLPLGDRNPLRNYFASLEQTAAQDLRCVMPALHDVYAGGVARAQGLMRHHGRALEKFRTRLLPGMRGMVVATAVYGHRKLVLDCLLALTESLAHLQYLGARGEISVDAESRWHSLPHSPSVAASGSLRPESIPGPA